MQKRHFTAAAWLSSLLQASQTIILYSLTLGYVHSCSRLSNDSTPLAAAVCLCSRENYIPFCSHALQAIAEDFSMQVYGASLKDPANACLVMELVRGGNLHQRIYDRNLPRLTHMQILQVRFAMRRT